MKKTLAVFVVALLLTPITAFASIVQPLNISEQKAKDIVRSWDVTVSHAELIYEDIALWKVYGHHIIGIGPAKIKMNVVVKLDATNGEFVGLEVQRRDADYDKNRVLEKMKQYDISIQSIQFVRDYSPYWEIFAMKSMNIDGYWFEVPLYVHVDARTLTITHVSHEPTYRILPHPAVGQATEPAIPMYDRAISEPRFIESSSTPYEVEVISGEAVEVQ